MPTAPLYGISDYHHLPDVSGASAEVLSADALALDGGDLIAPAVIPKMTHVARPVSPSTIEKSASMLRSLSFAAARPATRTETPAERGRAYAAVGQALRQELQGDQMAKLRTAAPELGPRIQAALLAACGALLSSQDADAGFEWAGAELDDLAKNVPPSTSAVFPGAYYHEIFSSDVAELTRSLAQRRREEMSRRALAQDVLQVLSRPGVGAAEVYGIGKAADDMGLAYEAAACRQVADLVEREERARLSHEAATAEAREARRLAKESDATAQREARNAHDEKQRRQHAVDELNGLKAALAREEEVRRKVEAAQVRTMEEMRQHEEARWHAVNQLQAESVRCGELEAAARRAEEDGLSRAESAEARMEKAVAEAARATKQYVEAEKMRTALQGRVSALDDVKVQLEQQLHLERNACAVELGLRQQAEAQHAQAAKAAADAQQAASEATSAAEVAKAALEQATKELAAVEERLRVANDGSLDQQMASAAAEEHVKQLKALRTEDANKMQRLNTEKATLEQKVADLDVRVAGTLDSAEHQEGEAKRQRYELQEQLTKLHRHCEDLQAKATRAELLLQHEREQGHTASEMEKKLAEQLDQEKRARQALSQQLSAEAALRQKSDAAEAMRSKELHARDREAELGGQRVQSLQGELHRAREEARQAREALADARAIAKKLERERDAEREDARRERYKRDAHGAAVHPATFPAAAGGGGLPGRIGGPGIDGVGGGSPPLGGSGPTLGQRPPRGTRGGGPVGGGPSLQQHLPMPPRETIAPPPPAQSLGPQPPLVSDELSRSDIWNFSNGALARAPPPRHGGAANVPAPEGVALPRIKSPFNTAGNQIGLSATSLDPAAARQLYGATAVPGLGDDDEL